MRRSHRVTLDSSMFGEIYHIVAANVAITRPWEGAEVPAYNLSVNTAKATPEQAAFLSFAGVQFTASKISSMPLGETTKRVTECLQEPQTPDQKVVQKHIFQAMLGSEYAAMTRAEKDALKDEFEEFIVEEYGLPKTGEKLLLRVRFKKDNTAYRNISVATMQQVLSVVAEEKSDAAMVILGNASPAINHPRTAIFDLRGFYKKPRFLELSARFGVYNGVTPNNIAAQLFFQRILQDRFGLSAAIGMKSGALDGPGFYGLPTVFFCPTKGKNRMMGASANISSFNGILYCDKRYNQRGKHFQKMPAEALEELRENLPKNITQQLVGALSVATSIVSDHAKTVAGMGGLEFASGFVMRKAAVLMLGYLTLMLLVLVILTKKSLSRGSPGLLKMRKLHRKGPK